MNETQNNVYTDPDNTQCVRKRERKTIRSKFHFVSVQCSFHNRARIPKPTLAGVVEECESHESALETRGPLQHDATVNAIKKSSYKQAQIRKAEDVNRGQCAFCGDRLRPPRPMQGTAQKCRIAIKPITPLKFVARNHYRTQQLWRIFRPPKHLAAFTYTMQHVMEWNWGPSRKPALARKAPQ